MEVTVVGCARCGETHYDMEFARFTRPIVVELNLLEPDIIYTHWTMCPEQNEPILMRIIEESEIDANAIDLNTGKEYEFEGDENVERLQ